MNKRLMVCSIVVISFFMAGCTSNKEVSKPTVANSNVKSSEQSQTKQATSDNKGINSNKSNSTAQHSNRVAKVYGVTQDIYKNKNIIVKYPQIINLGDDNKQDKINQLIKDDVELYVNNNYVGNTSIELKYNIKLQTSDLLSIQYSGFANAPGAAHPTNVYYTTNIDIKNGTKLRLSDLVKVDQNLVNAFNKGQYVDVEGKSYDKEAKASIIEFVNGFSTSDLMKYFSDADTPDITNINTSSTFSFITKDSIVISVNVPHALGDHAEFQINYKYIQDNINAKNSILKDLVSN